MAGIGAQELLIVLVIVLVLFGGTRLPKLARSIGTARREFELGQTTALAAGADSSTGAPATVADASVERAEPRHV